jgi:nifR3 family TIM-barrel protein
MSGGTGRLHLGSVELDFPVVFASLAGYSDLPYRLICRACGAPYAATEVMLDRFLLSQGKRRRQLCRLDPADHPVGGQIMGNEPPVMAEAAVVLRDLGFDVIDLNFACPVKKVLARKRGGYLLKTPSLALEIVESVRAAVPDRPLTLKLRRSFAAHDPGREAFWAIARGAFEAGVDAITVHARSVEQRYSGPADWAFLAEVKRAFPGKTIVGSGDVREAADALRMMAETGVDGVSTARGAIGNPWIFRQARDLAAGREPFRPSLVEQADLMARHFDMAAEYYGLRRALGVMRHFGIGYARSHTRAKSVRMAFVAVKSEADWRAVLDAYYRPEAPAAG